MSEQLVTGNDLAQALSRTLLDISMGRNVKKSRLEQLIAASDVVNRRMQTNINAMKVMIEAKKHGIDFAAAMKEIRSLAKDAEQDVSEMLLLPQSDE